MGDSIDNSSLRKTIEYDLHYVTDEGVEGVKRIPIRFVSTRISNLYMELQKALIETVTLSNDISSMQKKLGEAIGSLRTAQIDKVLLKGVKPIDANDLKDLVAETEGTLKNKTARLNELGSHAFDYKWNVIQALLIKNGITDTDLLNRTFWEDCIDSRDVMDFIANACNKDNALLESKKKELAPM